MLLRGLLTYSRDFVSAPFTYKRANQENLIRQKLALASTLFLRFKRRPFISNRHSRVRRGREK